MRAIRVLCFITTSVCLSSCSSGDNAALPQPPKAAPPGYSKCQSVEPDGDRLCDPSVIELIVRPEWYDGAEVVVAGVLHASSESFALFASTEDHQQYLTRKGLALIRRQGADFKTEGLNGRWVWARGKFLPRQRSGNGLGWGGTLADVRSIWYAGTPGAPSASPRPSGK
jgi:hypothetical protein